MKFKYNKEDDILMIELNDKNIDYAEQSGDLIVHFSPKREVVLIEMRSQSYIFCYYFLDKFVYCPPGRRPHSQTTIL